MYLIAYRTTQMRISLLLDSTVKLLELFYCSSAFSSNNELRKMCQLKIIIITFLILSTPLFNVFFSVIIPDFYNLTKYILACLIMTYVHHTVFAIRIYLLLFIGVKIIWWVVCIQPFHFSYVQGIGKCFIFILFYLVSTP